MANVLIYVESAGGALRSASLPAITFGRKLAEKTGGKLSLLLIGNNVGHAAEEAAKDKGATHIGATSTATGKDLLPRVAAMLDAGLAADVTDVVSANQFKRPLMAGNVIATVQVDSPTVAATVRQTAFEPAQPAGAGAVSKIDAGTVDTRGAAFVALHQAKSERPELTEAKVVVSGGRGMREG